MIIRHSYYARDFNQWADNYIAETGEDIVEPYPTLIPLMRSFLAPPRSSPTKNSDSQENNSQLVPSESAAICANLQGRLEAASGAGQVELEGAAGVGSESEAELPDTGGHAAEAPYQHESTAETLQEEDDSQFPDESGGTGMRDLDGSQAAEAGPGRRKRKKKKKKNAVSQDGEDKEPKDPEDAD